MDVSDRLYGTCPLPEPIFADLLHSAPLRRLQGVLQHGISGLLGITTPTTRYEHSLGTALLVRRLGGTLEEQVAALLHDVSHTAFSHVIDFVFHDHGGQSFHDREKVRFVRATSLPAILSHYGYAWEAILDESAYPLLEQPAPALCADRLDYFLRDGLDLGLITPAEAAQILAHLVVVDGRIGLGDVATARLLADAYMGADNASWSDFREVGLYEVTARALRRALRCGALTEADLWGEDRPLFDHLRAHPDPELQRLLQLVSPATRFVHDPEQPTFTIQPKVRTIDPDVLLRGRLQPLSQVDAAFAARRHAYRARKQTPWPMRVVAYNH